jgi:hypothetical protein
MAAAVIRATVNKPMTATRTSSVIGLTEVRVRAVPPRVPATIRV